MSLLPSGFVAPAGFETAQFRLRPIRIHDVVKDYDAVMNNREHLWSLFGGYWGWPAEDLTLEQDLIDLAWHQKEAQLRRSFSFAILTLDERRLLGCVYVEPTAKQGFGAECFLWVRKDGTPPDLEQRVFALARDWLREKWPFERVAWPGREIEWAEWDTLP